MFQYWYISCNVILKQDALWFLFVFFHVSLDADADPDADANVNSVMGNPFPLLPSTSLSCSCHAPCQSSFYKQYRFIAPSFNPLLFARLLLFNHDTRWNALSGPQTRNIDSIEDYLTNNSSIQPLIFEFFSPTLNI